LPCGKAPASRLSVRAPRVFCWRAVYIARELGLEAYGVASDQHDYGEIMVIYRLREMVARNKDFFIARFLKPQPTFLGEVIPVTGDGRVTDDK